MGKNSPEHHDMNGASLCIGDLVRFAVDEYMGHYDYGVVTSKNDADVFVRFFGNEKLKACYAIDLEKG